MLKTMLKKMIITFAIVSVASLSFGSGDSNHPSNPLDKTNVEEPLIEWEPCPLITEPCPPGEGLHCVSEDSTLDAECAFVKLPASYNDPSSPTLEVFLKRKKAKQPSRGQLWLLMGGPTTSVELEPTVEIFEYLREDLDIYLIERRGFGRSTKLQCPEQEAENSPGGETITTDELNDCAAVLEEEHGSLEYFRTTYAAHDLDRLIQATRKDDDEVYIYGTSYGTFWLNHFLQVTSQPLDGLVFDGGCGSKDCCFNSAAAILGWDATGRRLLRQCAEDEHCGSYLPDPEETLAQLYGKLDNGHCPALGIGGESLFDLVGIMPTSLDLRDYIPSFIYRIDRCELRDIEALTELFHPTDSPAGNDAVVQHHSEFLADHITSNELWIKPAPEFTHEECEKYDNRLFGEFTSSKSYIDRMADWPATYSADEFAGQIASTDVPVLFLQGTLDAQTPLEVADPFGKSFDGPNQNHIYVYDAGHNVLWDSPMPDSPDFSCGMDLIGQFLNNPRADLDTSCAYGVTPLNFDAKELYGTDDAWN